MNKPEATTSRPLPYFINFSSLYGRAEAISHAYQGGNLVFFLGAGASKAFQSSVPNWSQLLKAIVAETRRLEPADKIEIDNLITKGKFLLAAEALKRFSLFDRDDRDEAMDSVVHDILDREMKKGGDRILHFSVLDFATPIVTTNFDTILEDVRRQLNLDRVGSVFTFEDDKEIAARLNPTEAPSQYIFKLHGTAGHGKLILDEGDYANLYFRNYWPRAIALLHHILSTKMVVFVGFSLSDPEIMPLLREATRHASSYQHLAFLKEDDVTRIERDVLRSHYHVDPIVYHDHAELPLYILEMRNFYPRDRLTLKLVDNTNKLTEAASEIRIAERLSEDCSIVLFGSYAKYGEWVSDEADMDILFLSPSEIERVGPKPFTRFVLGRRVDATIMSRLEFEALLRQGDAFASSILVTGSPIADPKGIFTLLALGLRPKYIREDLIDNAYRRCQLRWLRLCALRNRETKVFLRSCQQWALTVMQLALIQAKPPTSLLEASLLGNARHVIDQFVNRFSDADDAFFLDLMRRTKGLNTDRHSNWPEITEAVNVFRHSFAETNSNLEQDLVESDPSFPMMDAGKIAGLYESLKPLFIDIDNAQTEDSLPGKTELKLFEVLTGSDLRREMNTFDWLFFFEIRDLAMMQNVEPDDRKMLAIIKEHQINWKAGKWGEVS